MSSSHVLRIATRNHAQFSVTAISVTCVPGWRTVCGIFIEDDRNVFAGFVVFCFAAREQKSIF